MPSSALSNTEAVKGAEAAAGLPRLLHLGAVNLPELRQRLIPYAFLLPGFALFTLFVLYPLLSALRLSFFHWRIVGSVGVFVGMQNYAQAFRDPIALTALRNTLIYALGTVPTQMLLGLLVAVLLDSIERLKVFFRTLYYLPVITSWVVVSVLFRYLFSSDAGPANSLLQFAHVTQNNVGWLIDPPSALFVIGLLGVWKGVGWSMLIFLAALQGVPRELKEAAAVDGAGPVRTYVRVVIPQLGPVALVVLILLVIGSFNVFTSVYLLTGGGPVHETEVLLTYMYHQAFDFLDFGYGSALAYLVALLVFVVSLMQMRLLRPRVG
jgi:multiple sugar transport system permease protein